MKSGLCYICDVDEMRLYYEIEKLMFCVNDTEIVKIYSKFTIVKTISNDIEWNIGLPIIKNDEFIIIHKNINKMINDDDPNPWV